MVSGRTVANGDKGEHFGGHYAVSNSIQVGSDGDISGFVVVGILGHGRDHFHELLA